MPSSLPLLQKSVHVSDFVSLIEPDIMVRALGNLPGNQYSLSTPTHLWIHAKQVEQARGAYKQITESQGWMGLTESSLTSHLAGAWIFPRTFL